MSKISKKILDDLEFPVVIDYLKNHCVSSEGKSAISKLKPFVNKLKAIDELVVAMLKFVQKPELIVRMGSRSRQIAEEKYDVNKINRIMLKVMGIKC